MAWFDVEGGRMLFETAGSGAPLILIHGLGADARIWDGQFGPFAESHQVVRYDLRGHGKSSLPGSDPYAHASDLNALLDHLGIASAALVGHSMGGEIAVEFALAYPDRVSRLVLADSAVHGYTWSPEWNSSWGPFAEALASGAPSAAVPVLLEHPLFAHAIKNADAKSRLNEIFLDYSCWHFLNADPVVFVDPPAIERLGQIAAPALVIVGQESVTDFHRIADILSGNLPNVQRIDLPGVGHVVPLEAPDLFNKIVLEFLG